MTTDQLNSQPTDADVIDLRVVDAIVGELGPEKRSVIPILQAIQSHFRYLPEAALRRVCETTEITPAQIDGIATFYSQFRHMPVGRHLISVCHGTACHVAGAEAVTESVRRHLGIEGDADTDDDDLFTVQPVACLGCCSLAPVMRIDDRVFGHLSADTAPRVIERFLHTAGRDEASFGAAAKRLGGDPIEQADAAYEFAVFPRVRVQLLWYRGDEEIGPGASFLYQKQIVGIFCVEDIVVMSELLVGALLSKH